MPDEVRFSNEVQPIDHHSFDAGHFKEIGRRLPDSMNEGLHVATMEILKGLEARSHHRKEVFGRAFEHPLDLVGERAPNLSVEPASLRIMACAITGLPNKTG